MAVLQLLVASYALVPCAYAVAIRYANPIVIIFELDPKRLDETYECEVTVSPHGQEKPVTGIRGSVRPTPGKGYPTINQGEYDISLGLHWRKTKLMADPSKLTKQQYETIVGSAKTFGATTKGFLKKYVKNPDDTYSLPESEKAAFGWMRKVLTIADPDKDELRIVAKSGQPRLGLVLENDAKVVSVTRPGPNGKRIPGKADLVHIHSGPDTKRSAAGCLTIPAKDWRKFLNPIVESYPTADDWVQDGYVGERIGRVVVTVKK